MPHTHTHTLHCSHQPLYECLESLSTMSNVGHLLGKGRERDPFRGTRAQCVSQPVRGAGGGVACCAWVSPCRAGAESGVGHQHHRGGGSTCQV